jgi:alkylhydroperoxidase family enzyme
MGRVQPLPDAQVTPAARLELDKQLAAHGRVTNMKRTLAHSPVALRALMTWYELREEVVPFLGERRTNLFAHAVSSQTDCLICSTFFRRILSDAGENPDRLDLDEVDQALVGYGRQLARDANRVDDELFAQLSAQFSAAQLVTLTVFGGLMIATNVFNNALQVDLDDYLQPYRKPGQRS